MEDLLSACQDLIAKDEDFKSHTYKDEFGNDTIGYGHLLSNGISPAAGMFIFNEDLELAINACKSKIDFFNNLSIPHQYVLVNMAFNMGSGGLLSFEKMLNYMKAGNYMSAADEIRNSLENKQVPNRTFHLIKIMESDNFGN